MRFLYSLFFYLLTPFLILRLLWKEWRHPRSYGLRMEERFGLNHRPIGPFDVWIHAVSVGEVMASAPLIEKLLAKGRRILLTTMTPTGSSQALVLFKGQVEHQYIPYDYPWALKRFFKRTLPKLAIIMETEIWPNLIHYTRAYDIPLVLANARVSDKAFKQYYPWRFFFKSLLASYSLIIAQSKEDASRLKALGAPQQNLRVLGNMKFDIILPRQDKAKFLYLKQQWGIERPVFIAASTHEDEELQLFKRFEALKATIPKLLLLVVPRHPARFKRVYEQSKALGLHTALRSQEQHISTAVEVVVVDSLGELVDFYAVSDYAFVGGSLVPVGGHNVLEPIALGVPVLTGPYMQNSKAICHQLVAAGGLKQVADVDELLSALQRMHHHPEVVQQQIAKGQQVMHTHRGCVMNYLQLIEGLLNN